LCRGGCWCCSRVGGGCSPRRCCCSPGWGAWTLVVRGGRRRGGGSGGAGVAHTHTGAHDESSLTGSRPECSTCEESLSCKRAIGHRWSTGTLKGVFSLRGEAGGGGWETGSSMLIQSTLREADGRCLGRGGMTERRGRAVEGRGTSAELQTRVQCGVKGQSAGTKGGR